MLAMRKGRGKLIAVPAGVALAAGIAYGVLWAMGVCLW